MTYANPETAERTRWLKRYGIHQPSFRDEWGEINPASDVPTAGYNSYMTNVAAAIGLEQMKYLPGIVSQHQANGDYYTRALADVPGLTLLQRPPHARSAYWVYTVLAERRDELLRALRGRGVYASKVHLRNDGYSCFRESRRPLPGVEAFSARYLCIPCGWWITEADREYIAAAIRKGW